MKKTKIEQRGEWLTEHRAEIEALIAEKPNTYKTRSGKPTDNAYYCPTASGGGWGYWSQAARKVGVNLQAMDYWSGSAPTPSTAINRAVAEYISKNCPEAIR